ncbi:MAG: hypothetical protein UDM29_02570 [Dialister sp.]|nr:hypothetical protein [Dialister sp.]
MEKQDFSYALELPLGKTQIRRADQRSLSLIGVSLRIYASLS